MSNNQDPQIGQEEEPDKKPMPLGFTIVGIIMVVLFIGFMIAMDFWMVGGISLITLLYVVAGLLDTRKNDSS